MARSKLNRAKNEHERAKRSVGRAERREARTGVTEPSTDGRRHYVKVTAAAVKGEKRRAVERAKGSKKRS